MKSSLTQSVSQTGMLHGLYGGWNVYQKGLGTRSASEPELLVYCVTLWTSSSVTPELWAAWNDARANYSRESALLGQKGAYSKLAALGEELQREFDSLIVSSLEEGKGAVLAEEEMFALAAVLSETDEISLYAAAIRGNHAQIVFTLTGELGVDVLVSRWRQSVASGVVAEEFHVQAVSPVQYMDIADAIMQKMGVMIASAAAIPQEDAEDAPDFSHVTVLLHETVDMLEPAAGKLIVDATLGGGGHAELLLERGAQVIGIDQDSEARAAASRRLGKFGDRFKAVEGNFRDVKSLLEQEGIYQIDGLLADIGVSSHQLDTPERGFSFREDGPLDMRMGRNIRKTAGDLVNELDERELADLIWKYGEEKASRPIARAIVKARNIQRIETTAQLAEIISSVMPRKGKQHPGTRTFQALRIAVNDELGALEDLLGSSVSLLARGGRMAVITFHSLEDRIVKQFFDHHSRAEIDRKEWPAPRPNPDYVFKLINKKPITAGEEELAANSRSRSAKLRGVEKIN